MKTKKERYQPIAYFHQRDGRNEPVFLADSPTGTDWMIINHKYRHDRRAADLVLLERPRSKKGVLGWTGPIDLTRRSRLEQRVAAALKALGITFIWQPHEQLQGLPGHPDIWVPQPRPLIISVRGCGPHAHDCNHPEALAVGDQEREFRRAHDRWNVLRWAQLGIPTIVVWGCAVGRDERENLQELTVRLGRAIQAGSGTEISSI
jgi:G:T-mismatch repair DNA endonuclease (very short patch repair protein)